jgi:hypothetical protein
MPRPLPQKIKDTLAKTLIWTKLYKKEFHQMESLQKNYSNDSFLSLPLSVSASDLRIERVIEQVLSYS